MARLFDGTTGDLCEMADSADFDLPDSENTQACWIRIDNNTGDIFGGIWSQGVPSASPSNNAYFRGTGKSVASGTTPLIEDSGGSQYAGSGGTDAATRTWQLIILERNSTDWNMFVGSSTNNVYTETVAGAAVNIVAVAASFDLAIRGSADVLIGAFAQYFKFNSAFTDNQKAALYNGINVFGLGLTLLVNSVLLGIDDPEPDFTGRGHTAAITGTTKDPGNPPVELLENYLN